MFFLTRLMLFTFCSFIQYLTGWARHQSNTTVSLILTPLIVSLYKTLYGIEDCSLINIFLKDIRHAFPPTERNYLESQLDKYMRAVGTDLSERMTYSIGWCILEWNWFWKQETLHKKRWLLSLKIMFVILYILCSYLPESLWLITFLAYNLSCKYEHDFTFASLSEYIIIKLAFRTRRSINSHLCKVQIEKIQVWVFIWPEHVF